MNILSCEHWYGLGLKAALVHLVRNLHGAIAANPELFLPVTCLFVWQVTAIGRAEIWPLHRRAAELGGNLRTGLEDTFYLPDGAKATSNGRLIAALARLAREVGRDIASPAEARKIFHLRPSGAAA